jgi:acetoin:2,6-dichlorophenolindophenol oxidoreductase subunit alpha
MTIKNKFSGTGFEVFKKSPLSKDREHLLSLFYDMLRIRLIEEKIEGRYCEDEMKSPIHLVIGQEAVSVGSCAAMKNDDLIYCGHRTHGHYLAKGGSLKGMLAELYCRINGCAGSRGGSMHLLDKSVGMAGSSAIVAGAIPIATGAALSFQLKKRENVAMVYFGDAATEEGACWEAINFGTLKKLPVVYFCENNFFSVCSPLEVRQPPNVEIYKKAAGFGLPSIQVDGTNVLAVYESTQEAIHRARNGGGPTFIEALTYRWRGHGGAGDDSSSGYRDPQEVRHWENYCPIEGFYDFLVELNYYNENERKKDKKNIDEEIAKAFEHAISSPNPEEKDLYTHVYSQ